MSYPILTELEPNMICHLKQFALIQIEGGDAEKFLQGQLTCDVEKLTEGESTLTAHCDAKGKVNAIFRLIRTEPQCFYALVKKSIASNALEELKKYSVFSNVHFTLLDWDIVGLVGEKINDICSEVPAQIRVQIPTKQPRVILLNPTSLDLTDNVVSDVWELLDIQDGIPNLAPQTQNEFIPQALNLQDIEQAISFQKGCYIGQETVARAKYRGINKRATFTLVGESIELPPQIGTEIEMSVEGKWRKTGTILNQARLDNVLWLQVVLNTPIEEGTEFRLSENTSLSIFA